MYFCQAEYYAYKWEKYKQFEIRGVYMQFSFSNEKKNCRRFPAKKPLNTDSFEDIPSDVNGSYTGVPYDPEDNEPVQDADDL